VKLCSLALALVGFAFASARATGSDWRDQVSTAPTGNFPELPSLRMHFDFLIEAGAVRWAAPGTTNG